MKKTVIKIKLDENLYLRDPQDTELGRKIVSEAVLLIDRIGFEQFTFKKLATKIESTEASVYRYFENKNKLLRYLMSWYWAWLDYKIQYQTNSVLSVKEKLWIIIKILCADTATLLPNTDLDEQALYRLVVSESTKSYIARNTGDIYKEDLFLSYKSISQLLVSYIKELNPKYKYPLALTTTIIEAAHLQTYFATHEIIPIGKKETTVPTASKFIEHLLWSAIEAPAKNK